MSLLTLVCLTLFAQDPRPLPKGTPDVLVHPSLRVSLVVSEQLDPDQLRALSSPQVTLWLLTSSNTLSSAVREHLGRYAHSFVQLHRPLTSKDLPRAPAGAWLDASTLELASVVSGRPLAIEVVSLDEATLTALASARPTLVRWSPTTPVSLADWASFSALPGRRVFAPTQANLLAVRCVSTPELDGGPAHTDAHSLSVVVKSGAPAVEVHAATLLAMGSDVFPCGSGSRVIVEPTVDRWLVQSLLVRDPAVELVIEIGADEQRARAARSLLEALGVLARSTRSRP